MLMEWYKVEVFSEKETFQEKIGIRTYNVRYKVGSGSSEGEEQGKRIRAPKGVGNSSPNLQRRRQHRK